jgi:DNA-binding transcriptional LysR family regulator
MSTDHRFYYVAKTRSSTRATEAPFRTRSALSQQVKVLEEELECQLFERIGKKKIQLTLTGEKLFRFSEMVLQNYDQLKEELGELKGIHKRNLKIAAPFTTLYHLTPGPVNSYLEQFPNLELSLLDRPQQTM